MTTKNFEEAFTAMFGGPVIPNDIGRWKCVRCETDFRFTPYKGEAPYAFEILTDANGWQTHGGEICRSCHELKSHHDARTSKDHSTVEGVE